MQGRYDAIRESAVSDGTKLTPANKRIDDMRRAAVVHVPLAGKYAGSARAESTSAVLSAPLLTVTPAAKGQFGSGLKREFQ